MQKLMEKCEKISTEMEVVISELTSESQLEDGANENGYITKQPALLNSRSVLSVSFYSSYFYQDVCF